MSPLTLNVTGRIEKLTVMGQGDLSGLPACWQLHSPQPCPAPGCAPPLAPGLQDTFSLRRSPGSIVLLRHLTSLVSPPSSLAPLNPESPRTSSGKVWGGHPLPWARPRAEWAGQRAGPVPTSPINGAGRAPGLCSCARRPTPRSAVSPRRTRPLPAPDMERQKALVSRCGELVHIRYRLLRQALAECLGTLILVVSRGTQRSPYVSGPHTPQSFCSLESCCFSRQPYPSPNSDPHLDPLQSALPPSFYPLCDGCYSPVTALILQPPPTSDPAHRLELRSPVQSETPIPFSRLPLLPKFSESQPSTQRGVGGRRKQIEPFQIIWLLTSGP